MAGTEIISEKAMCMLGTAAYGLTSRPTKRRVVILVAENG